MGRRRTASALAGVLLAAPALASLVVPTPSHAALASKDGGFVDDGGGVMTPLADGRVLFSGGVASGDDGSSTIYDPTTASKHRAPGLITDRYLHGASLLEDGSVLISGGHPRSRPSTDLTSAERFDVGTETWSPAGNMGVARAGETQLTLPDGRAFVVGGTDSRETSLYDPTSNTWSTGAAVPGVAAFGSAALTSTGRVLVTTTGPAYLYNPATDSFTSAGPGSHRGSVAQLADGRDLLMYATGFDGTRGEIYDARAGTWTPTAPSPGPCFASPQPVLAALTSGPAVVACASTPRDYSDGSDHTYRYQPSTDAWDAVTGGRGKARQVVPLTRGRALLLSVPVETTDGYLTVFVDGPGMSRSVAVGGHGPKMVDVSWRPPLDDGGSPITSYRITDSNTNTTTVVPADQLTVTLPSTGQYDLWTVRAVNQKGVYGIPANTPTLNPDNTPCTITGTAGDDVLIGTPGNDVICGLAGDDRLEGRGGDDTLIGGAGIDIAGYEHSPQGVRVTFDDPFVHAVATGEGSDTLDEVENIEGSPYDDVLTGGEHDNYLFGGAGDDTIDGRGALSTGQDRISGGLGRDTLAAESYSTLIGGPGLDTLDGSQLPGNFPMHVDLGAGTLILGDGYEQYAASTTSTLERVLGSHVADVIRGSSGRDWLRGGYGNDQIYGLGGDDVLHGDNNADALHGGDGTDRCFGENGTDTADTCESTVGVP